MSYIKYIKYLPILLMLLSVGWLYWQNDRLESRLENTVQQVNTLEDTNERLNTTIQSIRTMALEQSESLEQLFSGNKVLEQENRAIQRELEGYRNRENTILQRPTLVERRINDASRNVMQQYSCTTRNDCSGEGDN